MKFQRAPLKFHTKFGTYTLQNVHFTDLNGCLWFTISLNCDVISVSETGPGWPYSATTQSSCLNLLVFLCYCSSLFIAFNWIDMVKTAIGFRNIYGALITWGLHHMPCSCLEQDLASVYGDNSIQWLVCFVKIFRTCTFKKHKFMQQYLKNEHMKSDIRPHIPQLADEILWLTIHCRPNFGLISDIV